VLSLLVCSLHHSMNFRVLVSWWRYSK
jgi:hypothetical protein